MLGFCSVLNLQNEKVRKNGGFGDPRVKHSPEKHLLNCHIETERLVVA